MMSMIDRDARECFERDIARFGCAGISAVQTCYRALTIDAHRHEYLTGKRGDRDGRSAVFLEASKLKNSASRVLAFFLALGQMGYASTVATEEVLAAQICISTGGLCRPRTFRAALAMLVGLGWLTKRLIPTGTRIIAGNGPDGEPVWRTLRVNKISLTPAAKILISKRSVYGKYLPRQKLPQTKETKVSSPLRGLKPLFEETSTNIEVYKYRELSKDKTTHAPAHADTCAVKLEHDASRPACDRKPAEKAGSGLRNRRNRIPKTWDLARHLLLHDLEMTAQTENEQNIDTLSRVATLQTDRRYPRLAFCAVNWDTWLPAWLDLIWSERRRIVKLHILPALTAFCAHLTPPDVHRLNNPRTTDREIEKITAQLAGYRRLRDAMMQIPRQIFFSLKTQATKEEKISDNEILFTLEQIPWLLNAGKLLLSHVRPSEHAIFSSIAEKMGIDD